MCPIIYALGRLILLIFILCNVLSSYKSAREQTRARHLLAYESQMKKTYLFRKCYACTHIIWCGILSLSPFLFLVHQFESLEYQNNLQQFLLAQGA